MGDRKTDAAESFEDVVAFDFGKILQDMLKFDKPLDGAVSATVSQAIINAQTLQHQATQNAVLAGNIANYMALASFGRFLNQMQGIDVQTLIEGMLTKKVGENIVGEEAEAKPKPKGKGAKPESESK